MAREHSSRPGCLMRANGQARRLSYFGSVRHSPSASLQFPSTGFSVPGFEALHSVRGDRLEAVSRLSGVRLCD
jgi:hypothetical protein